MTPRLSIVVPTLNCADTLPRALQSVPALSFGDVEIIVVDDGSTDDTPALLAALSAKDTRLVVIRRDGGQGAAAARNAGIARARAELVAFLDADDAWTQAAMRARLAWHDAHPDAVLSFSDHWTLLPDGRLEASFNAYTARFTRHVGARSGILPLGRRAVGLLCGENPVCTTGVMARREALVSSGGFDESLPQAEDWDLWIRLARQGPVAYSTEREVLHARRPDALSTDVGMRTACVDRVMRRHLPSVLRQDPAAALSGVAVVLESRGELAHRRQQDGRALLMFVAAAMVRPSSRRLRDAAYAGAVLAGLRQSPAQRWGSGGSDGATPGAA